MKIFKILLYFAITPSLGVTNPCDYWGGKKVYYNNPKNICLNSNHQETNLFVLQKLYLKFFMVLDKM